MKIALYCLIALSFAVAFHYGLVPWLAMLVAVVASLMLRCYEM